MGSSEFSGTYYDGRSSRKRLVTIRLSLALQIFEDGKPVASWPYADIRRVDGGNALKLRLITGEPTARLETEDAAAAAILRERCTSLEKGGSGHNNWHIVGWSLGAICSIALLVLYGVPLAADRLAPLVPAPIEKRLGEAVDKQARTVFGGAVCERPEGQRAFLKLVGSLVEAGGAVGPIQAQVLSSGIPNAIALPGGKLYLFNGLLGRARNPDEIAGVLAHEIGHLERRDAMRGLIRAGGTSFLFGLLLGDITGGGVIVAASQALITASYSRDVESEADAFAARAMVNLGRSPAPMGELLIRITGTGKGTILDSHPVSSERLEALKRYVPTREGPPLLTDREWKALTEICVGQK